MIEISEIIRSINTCVHDDTLYLLDRISDSSGLFAFNGNILYAIKNEEKCDCLSIKTEYLHLESNIRISSFNTYVQSFENGYYNYIELFISDAERQIENIKAFINICSSYASQTGDMDFTTFFDSLVTLFQLPHEQEYKNLVGLFGELSVIKYFYDNFKEDISKYWHTDGINSKIDIVTPNINIEVKTTTTDQLLFKLKHAQIFDNNVATYLAAVSITDNNSGTSLNELIKEMMDNQNYCNSLSFAINIEMEKRRVSPKEAESRRFVLKSIRIYNSKDICPFSAIPENISDLSYKIDLSRVRVEEVQRIVKK